MPNCFFNFSRTFISARIFRNIYIVLNILDWRSLFLIVIYMGEQMKFMVMWNEWLTRKKRKRTWDLEYLIVSHYRDDTKLIKLIHEDIKVLCPFLELITQYLLDWQDHCGIWTKSRHLPNFFWTFTIMLESLLKSSCLSLFWNESLGITSDPISLVFVVKWNHTLKPSSMGIQIPY